MARRNMRAALLLAAMMVLSGCLAAEDAGTNAPDPAPPEERAPVNNGVATHPECLRMTADKNAIRPGEPVHIAVHLTECAGWSIFIECGDGSPMRPRARIAGFDYTLWHSGAAADGDAVFRPTVCVPGQATASGGTWNGTLLHKREWKSTKFDAPPGDYEFRLAFNAERLDEDQPAGPWEARVRITVLEGEAAGPRRAVEVEGTSTAPECLTLHAERGWHRPGEKIAFTTRVQECALGTVIETCRQVEGPTLQAGPGVYELHDGPAVEIGRYADCGATTGTRIWDGTVASHGAEPIDAAAGDYMVRTRLPLQPPGDATPVSVYASLRIQVGHR